MKEGGKGEAMAVVLVDVVITFFLDVNTFICYTNITDINF